jgi:HK97 family phage prohead protease
MTVKDINMKDYIKTLSPNAERRFVSEPVQFRAEDENIIEGYAAVFNKPSQDFGGWNERIAPGAFADVLTDDAVALFNHDMNYVLGRNGVNVTLSEDERGLKYTVKLPDTSFAKDLRNLIKDGIIHQSSFAFTVKEQEWKHSDKREEPSVRTIKKVKRLYDVSPVTTPAYPDATVGARSFAETKPKEEQEEILSADLIELKLIINKNL